MKISFCKKCVSVCVFVSLFAVRPFVLFTVDIMFRLGDDSFCEECKKTFNESSVIPNHIHQIFFNVTGEPIPVRFQEAMNTWKQMNPTFKYTLWTEAMTEELMSTKYKEFWGQYSNYGHWIQKIDLARYAILHQYGGVYVDVDIKCVQNMHGVLRSFPKNTGLVGYWTKPTGIASDFLASKPNHPFVTSLLTGLSRANRWYLIPYLTPLFSTGPIYIYGRYLRYKNGTDTGDILTINNTNKFLKHLDGATWHGWDGKAIWWIFIHKQFVLKIVIIIIFLLMMAAFLVIAFRKRRIRQGVLIFRSCFLRAFTRCLSFLRFHKTRYSQTTLLQAKLA